MLRKIFKKKEHIKDMLSEKRPLPTGMTEFEEWSDRIISGSMITALPESQKFTLASMIMHLAPTEAFKEDVYFINSLRKFAANQIADAKMKEIRDAAKTRLAAEEAKKSSEVTPTNTGGAVEKVLENKQV